MSEYAMTINYLYPKQGRSQASRLTPWFGGAVAMHLALLAIVLPGLPKFQENPIGAPMLVSLVNLTTSKPNPVPESAQAQTETKKITPQKPQKTVQTSVPVIATSAPSIEIAPTLERVKAETAPVQAAISAVNEDKLAEKQTVAKTEPIEHVEEKIEPPKFGVAYLNNPAPEYPSLSRRKGDEGRVLLKVLVSADGKAEIVQLEKTSGFDSLDEAAMSTVKQWRFVPAHKGNENLSAYVIVPIRFSLKNQS